MYLEGQWNTELKNPITCFPNTIEDKIHTEIINANYIFMPSSNSCDLTSEKLPPFSSL